MSAAYDHPCAYCQARRGEHCRVLDPITTFVGRRFRSYIHLVRRQAAGLA